jgi:hypothetical protein
LVHAMHYATMLCRPRESLTVDAGVQGVFMVPAMLLINNGTV